MSHPRERELQPLLDAGERVQVVVRLETDRLWAVLTTARLLIVDPDALHLREAYSRHTVPLEHHTGWLRDELVIAGRAHRLPMGEGKRAQELFDQVAGGGQESALPHFESRLMGALPTSLRDAIHTELTEGEVLLGALPTDGDWWVVTDRRQARVSAQGEWREQGDPGALRLERSTTRDRFFDGASLLFSGPWVSGSALRDLFELAQHPPGERLLAAAQLALERGDVALVTELLDGARERQPPAQEGALVPVERLRFSERLTLLEARLAFEQDLHDTARATLKSISRPKSSLVEVSDAMGLEEPTWWELLAEAHAQAGHPGPSAEAWLRAAESNGHHLAHAAQMLEESEAREDALATWERYLDEVEDLSDEARARGHAAAGALCETLEDLEGARDHRLEQVRRLPLEPGGYAALFGVIDAGAEDPSGVVARCQRAATLLEPHTEEAVTAFTPPPGRLDPESHALLLHPAERELMNIAQRWVGLALTERRDTADIEKHCQPLTSRYHPEAFALLEHLSGMLALPTPAGYVSYGTTGAQVLGTEKRPFLLLGAAHLDPDSERHLEPAELAFALGSQLEHLRAGHVLLTRSEFWTAFASRALDGVTSVLSLIPALSWLRKVTDSTVLSALAKLQDRVESPVVRKLLKLGQRHAEEGAVGDRVVGTLGRARNLAEGALVKRSDSGPARESLIKESLADYARGALYSADRVGLLACGDLGAAVRAMLKLSPRAFELLGHVPDVGLAQALDVRNDAGELRFAELGLRVGELFGFALSDAFTTLADVLSQARFLSLGPPEPVT